VPRINPLPKRDREIAARIRKFRRESKCSRSYLADRIGVNAGIITRIELGRIPLKYDVAKNLFKELGLNPLWVATGEGDPKRKISLPSTAELRLSENALFSDVFFTELLPLFKTQGPDAESEMILRYQRGQVNGAWVKELFAHYIPDGRVIEFEGKLSDLWRDFFKTFGWDDPKRRLRRLQRDIWYSELEQGIQAKKVIEAEFSKESPLTATSLKSNNGPEVKTEIQKLIEHVKRKASKPGMKAALAKRLEVAPARITEWLSGKKEPGGNYALRLQNWVNET
jgi:transcriptional regulator with XRE-family HTH domain